MTTTLSRYRLFFSFLLILGSSRLDFASTINAASPLAGDVQSAINQAADGDTVVIPPGTATWTTSVSIANKSITLTGAGVDQTIITRNSSTNNVPALNVSLRNSTKDFFNMSGFTWLTINPSQFGIVGVGTPNANGNPQVQFRITNCKFTSGGSGTRSLCVSGVYGLIDHCTFTNPTLGGQFISILQDNSVSTANTWHTPQFFGDTNAVYIEDCTFTGTTDGKVDNDGAVDCYDGMRYVFRHNTCLNTNVGLHGYDSSVRSARSFEVYNNTFSTTGGLLGQVGVVVRGGTGVVFNNTFPSGFGSVIAFNLYASDHVFARATAYAPSSAWSSTASTGGPGPVSVAGGPASGSNPVDGNSVGPSHPDQGYPLLDQPGRGSFPSTNTGNWPKVTSGYPSSAYEALDPIYQWGNTVGGNTSPTCGFNIATTANYVKANRDYYDNVQRPNYTPLQYPHPLIQNSSATAPAPPTNLTIVTP